MTTNHFDQLAQWYADAEQITDTNLPRIGDTLIFPYNADGYAIVAEEDDWTPDDVVPGEPVRILTRAPKPRPAWHDAVAVIAHTACFSERRPFALTHTEDVLDPYNTEWITRDDLIDPIPLIEAKVTDEMVLAALNAHMGLYLPSLPSFKRDEIEDMRYALTAALGLETK